MISHSRLLALLLVALGLSLAACGDETPPGHELRPSGELRAFIEEVAELRQLPPPSTLRIRTVSPADADDVYSRPTEEGSELATKIYRLLGFLDEDQHVRDFWGSVGDNLVGFYSSSSRTVWLITESGAAELGDLTQNERETLAHEIIHALQFQHFSPVAAYRKLGGWWNFDGRLALNSVIEGDAIVHTARLADQTRTIATADEPTEVPAPFVRTFWFPYITGADWARAVLANHGVEQLNGYLSEPPPATTLILHPELAGAGWEPEVIYAGGAVADILANLGRGWGWRERGSLGEFQLANYLVGDAPYSPGWLRAAANQAAVDAAAGWAGDKFFLLDKGGEALLVTFVRFVSEEDAREFAEAHRAVATRGAEVVVEGVVTLATRPDGNVVALLEPVGRDVIFAIGTNAEVARAAVEPLVGG